MFASNAAGVFAANHRIGAVLAVLAHAVGVLDADCFQWLAFSPIHAIGAVAAQGRPVVASVFVWCRHFLMALSFAQSSNACCVTP